MDCNTKWDWENLVLFNSKSVECPKKQTTNWGIEDGITGTCPFRLYEGKDSSSGSELAPGSSTRSSISVCTDSSFKEVMKDTHFAFSNIKAFPGDFCKKSELDELSLPLESSIGSGESVIGLKLGKRMYFENNSTQAESLAGVPRSFIASNVKKIKSSNSITPRCQVEGCNIDLSSAKEYHRKHKVCANHSKCPKVVVGGLERRFCQQCSRFHSLSEFDAKKRSCRKRLSDHNTRRRKPQLDLVQFNTMRLPSPFSAFTGNDGRRQINFVSNNVPHIYSRSSLDATWENTYDSKLTTSKGVLLKFGKTEGIDEPLDLAGTELPRAFNFPDHPFNGFLAAKGSKAETLSRGFEQPVLPQNLDSGRDFHRALSLLSNNSWGSYPPSNNSLGHSMNVNHAHNQHLVPSFPQTSAELCQTGHHSTDNLHSGPFQLFKAPYDDILHTILFN